MYKPLNTLLGALALTEHIGLLWWGAFWPWRHLTDFPEDGGVNQYMALASCLLVVMSLACAAARRRSARLLPLLLAMVTALPLAAGVLLVILNLGFLDPVVYYLALLPAVAAVLAPYLLATRLAH